MPCDDAAMHVLFDAMNQRVHTTCDKTVFFLSHYQICMCVVKLETCPIRAIIAALVASRAATRQCEQIIKTYKILFFPLVVLSHALLDAFILSVYKCSISGSNMICHSLTSAGPRGR